MATYSELMEQAQQLMAQAEQVRQEEIKDVVAEIRQKMLAYGLTPTDIVGPAAGRRSAKQSKKPQTVKYRGPNGETWGGGRGRKPAWVQEALRAGKKLEEEFAV